MFNGITIIRNFFTVTLVACRTAELLLEDFIDRSFGNVTEFCYPQLIHDRGEFQENCTEAVGDPSLTPGHICRVFEYAGDSPNDDDDDNSLGLILGITLPLLLLLLLLLLAAAAAAYRRRGYTTVAPFTGPAPGLAYENPDA